MNRPLFDSALLEAAVDVAVETPDLTPELLEAAGTTPEDVPVPLLREVVRGLQRFHARGERPDRALLASDIASATSESVTREEVLRYLAQLVGQGTRVCFPEYVARLRVLRLRRRLVQIAESARNGMEDAELAQAVGSLSTWTGATTAPLDGLAELLMRPAERVVPLIDHVIEPGSSALASAPAKMFKSTILVAAGLSVAAGVPVAGRLSTCRAAFLHVDAELGERRALALYRRLGRGEGIDVAALAREGSLLYVDATRPGPGRDVRGLTRLVRERRIGLVLLDPVVALFTGDENSASDVRAWFSATVGPLVSEGAGVLLIHHSRKGHPLVADNAADSTRGSGDWRGAPDVHVAMRAEPADRRLVRLEITGSRLGPEPAPFFLRVEDHNGGQRIVWAGEAEEVQGKTVAAADAIETLIERAADGGLPRQAILNALSPQFAQRTLDDALSLVRERGHVEVRRAGKASVYRRVRA